MSWILKFNLLRLLLSRGSGPRQGYASRGQSTPREKIQRSEMEGVVLGGWGWGLCEGLGKVNEEGCVCVLQFEAIKMVFLNSFCLILGHAQKLSLASPISTFYSLVDVTSDQNSDQSVSLSLLSYGYHLHPQSKLYK